MNMQLFYTIIELKGPKGPKGQIVSFGHGHGHVHDICFRHSS